MHKTDFDVVRCRCETGMDAAVFAIFYFSRAEKVVLHAERTESLALELGRMERKKNALREYSTNLSTKSVSLWGLPFTR